MLDTAVKKNTTTATTPGRKLLSTDDARPTPFPTMAPTVPTPIPTGSPPDTNGSLAVVCHVNPAYVKAEESKEPVLQPGSELLIVGDANQRYCGVDLCAPYEDGGVVECTGYKTKLTKNHKFTIVDSSSGELVLMGPNGKFCAYDEASRSLKCNRNEIGPGGRLTFTELGNAKITLQGGVAHKYCSDLVNSIACLRSAVTSASEKFTVEAPEVWKFDLNVSAADCSPVSQAAEGNGSNATVVVPAGECEHPELVDEDSSGPYIHGVPEMEFYVSKCAYYRDTAQCQPNSIEAAMCQKTCGDGEADTSPYDRPYGTQKRMSQNFTSYCNWYKMEKVENCESAFGKLQCTRTCTGAGNDAAVPLSEYTADANVWTTWTEYPSKCEFYMADAKCFMHKQQCKKTCCGVIDREENDEREQRETDLLEEREADVLDFLQDEAGVEHDSVAHFHEIARQSPGSTSVSGRGLLSLSAVSLDEDEGDSFPRISFPTIPGGGGGGSACCNRQATGNFQYQAGLSRSSSPDKLAYESPTFSPQVTCKFTIAGEVKSVYIGSTDKGITGTGEKTVTFTPGDDEYLVIHGVDVGDSTPGWFDDENNANIVGACSNDATSTTCTSATVSGFRGAGCTDGGFSILCEQEPASGWHKIDAFSDGWEAWPYDVDRSWGDDASQSSSTSASDITAHQDGGGSGWLQPCVGNFRNAPIGGNPHPAIWARNNEGAIFRFRPIGTSQPNRIDVQRFGDGESHQLAWNTVLYLGEGLLPVTTIQGVIGSPAAAAETIMINNDFAYTRSSVKKVDLPSRGTQLFAQKSIVEFDVPEDHNYLFCIETTEHAVLLIDGEAVIDNDDLTSSMTPPSHVSGCAHGYFSHQNLDITRWCAPSASVASSGVHPVSDLGEGSKEEGSAPWSPSTSPRPVVSVANPLSTANAALVTANNAAPGGRAEYKVKTNILPYSSGCEESEEHQEVETRQARQLLADAQASDGWFLMGGYNCDSCNCPNGVHLCEEKILHVFGGTPCQCQSCNAGHDKVGGGTSSYCKPRQCCCANGVGAIAADCPAHGQQHCVACSKGYTLSGTSCVGKHSHFAHISFVWLMPVSVLLTVSLLQQIPVRVQTVRPWQLRLCQPTVRRCHSQHRQRTVWHLVQSTAKAAILDMNLIRTLGTHA